MSFGNPIYVPLAEPPPNTPTRPPRRSSRLSQSYTIKMSPESIATASPLTINLLTPSAEEASLEDDDLVYQKQSQETQREGIEEDAPSRPVTPLDFNLMIKTRREYQGTSMERSKSSIEGLSSSHSGLGLGMLEAPFEGALGSGGRNGKVRRASISEMESESRSTGFLVPPTTNHHHHHHRGRSFKDTREKLSNLWNGMVNSKSPSPSGSIDLNGSTPTSPSKATSTINGDVPVPRARKLVKSPRPLHPSKLESPGKPPVRSTSLHPEQAFGYTPNQEISPIPSSSSSGILDPLDPQDPLLDAPQLPPIESLPPLPDTPNPSNLDTLTLGPSIPRIASPRNSRPSSPSSSSTSPHLPSSTQMIPQNSSSPKPYYPQHKFAPKKFNSPNISDILPFATAEKPYAIWDVISPKTDSSSSGEVAPHHHLPIKMDGLGITIDDEVELEVALQPEGWKVVRCVGRGRGGGRRKEKKVWLEEGGSGIGVYRVGWEREIMELLHETMYDLAGGSHTFYNHGDTPPKNVLDIGTGMGLWPISQAHIWKETTFVGLDAVPIQTNLNALAKIERISRGFSVNQPEGIWTSIARRVKWDKANFLSTLPYDTGVFDMVHIRFIALGVPETKWADILEEAIRVLRPGGIIEIVETSLTLPSNSHPSFRNTFSSSLLAEMIQPIPGSPIKFTLPTISGLSGVLNTATGKNQGKGGSPALPVYQKSWSNGMAPGALRDAVTGWARSSLDYRGTGIFRQTGGESIGRRATRELAGMDEKRWEFDEEEEEKEEVEETGDVTVWAWVGVKA